MLQKNIFVDATGIRNKPTGLGKYCFHLLKAITAQKDHNCRLTVLHHASLAKSHALFSIADERLTFLGSPVPVIGPKRDLLIYVTHRKSIAQHDIYHCLGSYLPAFRLGIPSIVTVHDLKYLVYPGLFDNWLKARYYGWILRRGAKKATRIIAVSAATKLDLTAYHIPAGKISVIHEASTLSLRALPSPAARVRSKDEPFFLYVGECRPHKNIARILEAYRILVRQLGSNSPRFVFVGSRIAKSFEEHIVGSSGKITFLDTVSEQTLINMYERAIALVYPSLYEGFGLPILEAMSLGTPVITSNRSAMPEVAGNAAILVDPLDVKQISEAMVTIVRKKWVRERLRMLGMRRAEAFSWHKTARATLSLYGTM